LNPIGSIVLAQYLEKRTSETGVSGWIGWKRRGKIRPVEIAGRCSERRIGRISDRRGIAVAERGRAGVFIGFANRCDRPPVLIIELGLPYGESCVRHGHVDECQETG